MMRAVMLRRVLAFSVANQAKHIEQKLTLVINTPTCYTECMMHRQLSNCHPYVHLPMREKPFAPESHTVVTNYLEMKDVV